MMKFIMRMLGRPVRTTTFPAEKEWQKRGSTEIAFDKRPEAAPAAHITSTPTGPVASFTGDHYSPPTHFEPSSSVFDDSTSHHGSDFHGGGGSFDGGGSSGDW